MEQTVAAFLRLNDDFHPDLRANVAAGHVTHTTRTLRAYNRDRQADLDRVRATMSSELGLDASDILEVPAILMPNPGVPSLADALIAGMVNMLVINGHAIVPKPFGPVSGGVDAFEADVSSKLTPLPMTVSFLDCWDTYHVNLGEIHCATNTLRTPTQVPWWQFEP